jgi:hypothetical protein
MVVPHSRSNTEITDNTESILALCGDVVGLDEHNTLSEWTNIHENRRYNSITQSSGRIREEFTFVVRYRYDLSIL